MTINAVSRSFACAPSDDGVRYTSYPAGDKFGDVGGGTGEGLLLSDGFESGNMATTNSDGFAWGSLNRTSIVTMDGASNNVVYPNPLVVNDGRDWTAKTGSNSLRFRYPAGSNWTEQRFAIGAAYPEIWMAFWLRVPTNFYHSDAVEPSNNKLMSLWMDGYEGFGEGSTVWLGFYPNGSGGSDFYCIVSAGDYSGGGGAQGLTSFITVPDNLGDWMHLVVRVVCESAPDASDGTMEVWRKWDGGSYTKTHNRTGQPIKVATSTPGFANGYLLGYANSPYSSTTEFLLDDFQLSTTDQWSVP